MVIQYCRIKLIMSYCLDLGENTLKREEIYSYAMQIHVENIIVVLLRKKEFLLKGQVYSVKPELYGQ